MTPAAPPTAWVRLYGGLNDFLKPSLRQRTVAVPLRGRPSVKDLVEGLGPPHTEVAHILADGRPVGFAERVLPGMRITAYPAFLRLDPAGAWGSVLTEPAGRPCRFSLDVHLGKLARSLRLLGFDVRYRRDWPDPDLVRTAVAEDRTVLTRDRNLLKRRSLTRGYWVRSQDPDTQVLEVMERFGLGGRAAPFTRCLACGGRLRRVEKRSVVGRLGPLTRRFCHTIFGCGGCGKLYWKGAHRRGLESRIDRWLGSTRPSSGDTR